MISENLSWLIVGLTQECFRSSRISSLVSCWSFIDFQRKPYQEFSSNKLMFALALVVILKFTSEGELNFEITFLSFNMKHQIRHSQSY